jgi:hypothetical protein
VEDNDDDDESAATRRSGSELHISAIGSASSATAVDGSALLCWRRGCGVLGRREKWEA